ncbi:aminotransferase class IV [Rubripirellula reticaptiva]|uniref:D-alanine aminotransferase n=1 Tax=Rubripirellula reticaptiva TaxID=2528013 RepID=A0A5C6EMT4_9BACT|nr:aminotransferase class IV [Rubripirellula reticaptiva]TWU49825.1 D-alanine aminotransferase [Rubripirellula reticaptiva]
MNDLSDHRIGYLSGCWVEHDQMRISVDDAGFRQGVTVVERLRTYGGVLFEVDAHLVRWQTSLDYLGLNLGIDPVGINALMDELQRRNLSWLAKRKEFGVTLFATPGISGGSDATLGIHLNSLDVTTIGRRQTLGQPVVITNVRQPHADVWARSIKVRCRLHYFRADSVARKFADDAMGMLVDDDGSVTESSIANFAIVESGSITSPPSEQVLGGITQSVVERIASRNSIPWRRERLSPDRVVGADEVLLMGTDTGVWFANRIGNHTVSGGKPGPVYSILAASDVWAG